MDKPIIIDGVDVSECKKLDREYAPNYPEIGGYDWFNECKETSTDCQGRNCLFKQLARKTQECEQLKEINAEIQESEIELENMKNSLFIDYMKYKQAIEEIEEIAKHCQQQDICTLCKNVDKCRDDYDEFSWNVANLIIQKCDEVNNSQNIRH